MLGMETVPSLAWHVWATGAQNICTTTAFFSLSLQPQLRAKEHFVSSVQRDELCQTLYASTEAERREE